MKYYCGIEQIPELLDEAMARYDNLPNVNLVSGNFITGTIPAMDYTLASGSLNYASADPAFIYKAIEKLYSCCNKGLAFNLLSNIPHNGLLTAYNPQDILTYCRTLTQNVILTDNYTDEDFTIYMYH